MKLLDVDSLGEALFWIPLVPLLGAAALGLLGRRLDRSAVNLVALGTVGTAAVMSALVLLPMAAPVLFGAGPVSSIGGSLGSWFSAGGLTVRASFVADHLSAVLAMVVTGVGLLVHVYSTGYMAGDDGYARYFAYLNLFVGSMLLLLLANDLVLMFVGWEGVGLCSYLLVGFWFDDDQKAFAGRKAFVVNRVGDFGLLVGLFVLLALFGTTEIQPGAGAKESLLSASRGLDLAATLATGPLASLGLSWGGALTLACLALFLGACGKSAQFPLYLWLPDAMAGPTPVSALIHAATMVTAGVYLVARLSFLFVLSPTAMAAVAAVGAFTALFAAFAALAQNDLKKLLAYSTVSQLGFMVLGVGLGAFWQATFHLVTHAFFKACLFLGAGSVILACRHEQDLRRLGGLRRRMGQTSKTFLVAALALAGVPPLSGFFSKDAILHFVHASAPAGLAGLAQAVYWVATFAALLTALYAFRLYFLVFEGEPRSEAAGQAQERGAAITAPLWALAGLALFASVWGWPWKPFAMLTRSGQREPLFQNFTHPVFAAANGAPGVVPAAGQGLLAQMGIAAAVALAGVGLAYWLWRRGGAGRIAPLLATGPGRLAARGAGSAFGTETLVRWTVVVPFAALAALAHEVIERFAIDGLLVGGARRLASGASRALRPLQNGDLQRYAAVMAIAAVLAIALALGFWTQLFTLGAS